MGLGMSLNAAIIDAMVESGCTAEQIAAVVKASLVEQEARAAEKRAKDAERQRKHRARNAVSRDVTVTDGDSVTDPSLSPSPNENNSNPHPHTHPETTPRARKGHRLPADWSPKPLTEEVEQIVAPWPAGAIERELARFRDWAASANGPNALKKDWDAAWRNWLRRRDEEGIYRAKSDDNRDKRDGVAKALDRRLGLDDIAGTPRRRDFGVGGGDCTGPTPRIAAV